MLENNYKRIHTYLVFVLESGIDDNIVNFNGTL